MRQKCFPDLCFYTYCCPTARWVVLSRWVPAKSCFRCRPERLRPPKRTPPNILRMIEELRKKRHRGTDQAAAAEAQANPIQGSNP